MTRPRSLTGKIASTAQRLPTSGRLGYSNRDETCLTTRHPGDTRRASKRHFPRHPFPYEKHPKAFREPTTVPKASAVTSIFLLQRLSIYLTEVTRWPDTVLRAAKALALTMDADMITVPSAGRCWVTTHERVCVLGKRNVDSLVALVQPGSNGHVATYR